MRASVLLAVLILAACSAAPSRDAPARGATLAPVALVGAWSRPVAGSATGQWLVLDADGSASLLGVDGLWGVAWRGEGATLVLGTQTPANPGLHELRLQVQGRLHDRLTLHAADGAGHAVAGTWQRRRGGIVTVAGRVSVSEPLALPPDAVLRLVLQPAARTDGPPLTLAVRDLPLGRLRFPVSYSLHLPEALLARDQVYVLRARVVAAGVQRYVSADHVVAPAVGAPVPVDVLLQPVQPVTRLRPPPPPPLAEQAVELERAFAAASRARGARAAFLEFLADDGILLQPGPVFGRAAWESRGDLPGELDWLPDRAAGAAAGDLAIASGHWLLTPVVGDARREGRYLTVWRPTAAGWRVQFDGGFGRPAAAAAQLPAVTPALDFGNCERGAATAAADLQGLDLGLSGDATLAHGERLLARAGANLAWFDEPELDSPAGAALATRLRAQAPRLSLRPMGGMAAASGDIGYTYGLVEPTAGATASHAYAHVWCRQQGDWKLLLVLRASLGAG